MSVYTVVTVVLVPFVVVYLLLMKRSVRDMRAGDEEWRRAWRELPAERRKAVRRRMNKGEAVEREDAELARRSAAQVEHVRKAMRPVNAASQAVLVFVLVAGLVSGAVFLTVLAAAGFGSGAVLSALAARQRRRFRRSLAATEHADQMN